MCKYLPTYLFILSISISLSQINYSDFQEHDVSFQPSFYGKILEKSKEVEKTDICILSHNSCNSNVILNILQNKDTSMRISDRCYQYQPYYTTKTNEKSLINVLNTVRVSGCTNVLLLLNLFELTTVFQYLNVWYIKRKRFITLLNSHHYTTRKLIKDYDDSFHITNIDTRSNVYEDAVNITKKTMADFQILFNSHQETE